MAWLIKARATMFIEERPGFIYLGEDTLVIPRVSCNGWKEFVNKVNELYKEYTSNIDGKSWNIEPLE